jgi:putative acetyltransferase
MAQIAGSRRRRMIVIRTETPDLHAEIRQIHLDAFPSPAEADLVERLRRDGEARIALAAFVETRLVGHIMLDTPFCALGLAPVAVVDGERRKGVAATLVRAGIEKAAAGGWDAIFVLGDPAYYERFGFSARAARDFESPYAGPHLMILALGAKGLPATTGRVDYAPAFMALE